MHTSTSYRRFGFAASRPARAAAALAVALALAACGGGSEDRTTTLGDRQRALSLASPALSSPASAGEWSAVQGWNLIPIHALLLPDGRVLTYGTDETGRQTGRFSYDIWDGVGFDLVANHDHARHNPADPSAKKLTATDLFCSSQILLAGAGTPTVSLQGGDNWTGFGTTNTGNSNSNLLDATTGIMTPAAGMNRPRWYSTSTMLTTGEVYIQGGSGGTDFPEIRLANGTFQLQPTDTSTMSYYYPRNWVAPDGRIFGFDAPGKMYYVDVHGSKAMVRVGRLDEPLRGKDSSAAMYRPGRILQFGGSISNQAALIDISTAGTPVVTPTQSLSSMRAWVNATILADGRVLATGGSEVINKLTGVNNNAEIWDPRTGQWTVGASAATPRLYHSMALLLPDATVLVGGGGAPGPLDNLNVEIYRPPYLFDSAGAPAARPSISTAPAVVEIGKTFRLATPQAADIRRVVMIKTGSVTHSFNMEQRFLELGFRVDGGELVVEPPSRAADATPGYYMVFVFDAAGVPSVARMVRVPVATPANPAFAPSLAQPAAQSTLVDAPVTLQLAGNDPNGDTLQYSAGGLPPGLSLDPLTGSISGTPTVPGTYHVTVNVGDGVDSDTRYFIWTITGGDPLTITSLQPPAPAAVNGTAVFDAAATGVNVQYRWDFGDGSAPTAWSATGAATYTYTQPGTYTVTLTVIDDRNVELRRSFIQAVHLPATANAPTASTNILVEPTAGAPRLWVVNQDNDSVSAFDTTDNALLGEVTVGSAPRAIARAADGSLWVTNKASASISVIDPATRTVLRTIALPRASQPYGIAMSPVAARAFVALEASGQLLQIDTTTDAIVGTVAIGASARHVSASADGTRVLVSRFITPPLPGEGTAVVSTPPTAGGLVVHVDVPTMTVAATTVLQHSEKPDFENQGRGIPNYLGAAVISPDGTQAWVPSKMDNIKRGALRDGQGLNFQSTVRAVSSRIVMASGAEDLERRSDHDNASLASAAAYDPRGVYLFVALETSREVAVIDAHTGFERRRVLVGMAPQGLAVSPDGNTLYVNNFMGRSVSVLDLRPLLRDGVASVPTLVTVPAVTTERLSPQVLLGKQLFYDARDTRLSRDRYMSCATCHNDGSHDGRVWDLTGFGEGLRNTASLRGRGGAQGPLHWSFNFDEVHDFEGQIRALAGGTGLMDDATYFAGTRSQPLGDPKAGLSADLDALAAYVASLNSFDASPDRPSAGTLSAAAVNGRVVFQTMNCASCHGGMPFTNSGNGTPPSIGTIKPTSGQRLGGPLTGIDIPTLRDVWATAPYLHDGSAATLGDAVRAHNGVSIGDADLANLVAYLREIGSDEVSAPEQPPPAPGTGLQASYFNNRTLSGSAVLTRTEAVNFNWARGSPAPGTVGSDDFSIRWEGFVRATSTGLHVFQTASDDGVRLWVNGNLVIDNWTIHTVTLDNSPAIQLTAGQRYAIKMEYFDRRNRAEARLRWQTPGASAFVAIPAASLYVNGGSETGSAVRQRPASVVLRTRN